MLKHITILIVLFTLSLSAQDNNYQYVEYDSLSNGYLSLNIDKKMDDLLESKKQRCNIAVPTNTGSSAARNDEPVKVADLCRQYPKMKGYRIQVLNTTSSDDAEKAREKVQMQFPQLSSNIVLRYPQFRLLLGDYFTKQNAAKDLNDVKKIYPGALLVVHKIWCNRAK